MEHTIRCQICLTGLAHTMVEPLRCGGLSYNDDGEKVTSSGELWKDKVSNHRKEGKKICDKYFEENKEHLKQFYNDWLPRFTAKCQSSTVQNYKVDVPSLTLKQIKKLVYDAQKTNPNLEILIDDLSGNRGFHPFILPVYDIDGSELTYSCIYGTVVQVDEDTLYANLIDGGPSEKQIKELIEISQQYKDKSSQIVISHNSKKISAFIMIMEKI